MFATLLVAATIFAQTPKAPAPLKVGSVHHLDKTCAIPYGGETPEAISVLYMYRQVADEKMKAAKSTKDKERIFKDEVLAKAEGIVGEKKLTVLLPGDELRILEVEEGPIGDQSPYLQSVKVKVAKSGLHDGKTFYLLRFQIK